VTEQGLVVQIIASCPDDRCVSPFGGHEAILSPNPFAFGVPTESDPILIDFSLSIVAEGYVGRALSSGEKLASHCLKDSQGNVSNDPNDYWSDPRGSIMPIGGVDHGYKGYGLCLWNELLTLALGNYGRADSTRFSEENSVFIQVIDPQAFGSLEDFQREAQFLADLCRDSRTRPADPPVRVPGDRALARHREQLTQGVFLYPSILEDLRPWAEKLNVSMPSEIESLSSSSITANFK
jgi:L-lactate dehydrogenase